MEKEYKILGNYIRLVDERNKNLAVTKLLGVSISKKFIPSIANIVGTDLSNYKIVRTGQFAYGPVTSRNGEKISIAYLDEEDCIISSSYTVFEVENKEELDPEYLMLWFSRPEFDRYARYKSHGSVREIFDWNELCMVELPVPDIEKQRKIVKAYKTITDRIDLKQKINDNLLDTAQTIIKDSIADDCQDSTVGDIIELFETGKHISVDIFSDEYMDKINAIQLPNTKIKILQRLLSQAIDEFKKVNKIMAVEFADRLKRVVDEYNNRRRDEAYANEVLDNVADQLAKLLEELKQEKNSFKKMEIDYEEKAFFDILKAVSEKYEFEYPNNKMIELSKRIKAIVDDKARYTDWSTREDIKANLQVDLILLMDEFDYPPVTLDEVYKEVLEQAENFKKYN